VVLREDREEALAVVPFDLFLKLYHEANE
jgi:hypothetical protein